MKTKYPSISNAKWTYGPIIEIYDTPPLRSVLRKVNSQ